MSDIAIRVDGLGKKYRLGANAQPYKTLRESLPDLHHRDRRGGCRSWVTRRPTSVSTKVV